MTQEAIEGALNQLAQILATQQGRKFERRIKLSTSISDFAVSPTTVRIHPSKFDGADVFSLIEKVFSLEEELDKRRVEYIKESVRDSRRVVEKHLRILKRHDPELHQWILPLIFNSERKCLCGP